MPAHSQGWFGAICLAIGEACEIGGQDHRAPSFWTPSLALGGYSCPCTTSPKPWWSTQDLGGSVFTLSWLKDSREVSGLFPENWNGPLLIIGTPKAGFHSRQCFEPLYQNNRETLCWKETYDIQNRLYPWSCSSMAQFCLWLQGIKGPIRLHDSFVWGCKSTWTSFLRSCVDQPFWGLLVCIHVFDCFEVGYFLISPNLVCTVLGVCLCAHLSKRWNCSSTGHGISVWLYCSLSR